MGRNKRSVLLLRNITATQRQPVRNNIQTCMFVDAAFNILDPFNVTPETVASGTLSQANIIGMRSSPVTLINAPGAGNALVINSVQLFHNYAVAAYTGGGKIRFVVGNLNVLAQPKDVITGGADNVQSFMVPSCYNMDEQSGTTEGYGLEECENSPLTITNDTASFAGGNAANILKWRITYKTVPLIT